MSSVKKKERRDKVVYEKRYGYIEKKKIEQAILHVLFPLEAYWRNIKIRLKVDDKIVNREGQIYPSFSDIVFTADYKVEMINPDEGNKFLIHNARGYVTCPICGKNIIAKLEDHVYETRNKVRKFTHEVAYEIAIMALAKGLAARMKRHIEAKHNYLFKRLSREEILIVRYIGAGQEVIFPARITTYRCQYGDGDRLYGVYGILDHIVTHHENTGKAREIAEYINTLTDTTKKIFGLGRDKVPILGAHRNTFWYILDPRGSDHFRVLYRARIKPWLYMELTEGRKGVNLSIVASIPRPMRMIYHYPIFRYVPHVIAYKANPEAYIGFMERTKLVLKRKGYKTENIEKIVELITGTLTYTRIEPRNAFSVDLSMLEELRKAIEDVGETARLFLSRKVV